MNASKCLMNAAFVVLTVGCAHPPHGEAKSGANGGVAATTTAQRAEAEFAEASTTARPSTAGARADQAHAQDREQAVHMLTEADSRTNQERQEFSGHARERLTKIDARANDVSVKANNSNAKTRSDVTTDWQAYSRQRDVISQMLNDLYSVNAQGWESTKVDVKGRLDALAGLVDRMGKRVDD